MSVRERVRKDTNDEFRFRRSRALGWVLRTFFIATGSKTVRTGHSYLFRFLWLSLPSRLFVLSPFRPRPFPFIPFLLSHLLYCYSTSFTFFLSPSLPFASSFFLLLFFYFFKRYYQYFPSRKCHCATRAFLRKVLRREKERENERKKERGKEKMEMTERIGDVARNHECANERVLV